MRELILSFIVPTTFNSVIARGVVWFLVSVVIIFTTDTTKPQETSRKLKQNLGLFFLFLVLSGGLIYLLFSFVPA